MVDKFALGQVLFQVLLFSPVNILPPMVHTRLHLHADLTKRTKGCGNLPKTNALSEIGHMTENYFRLIFNPLNADLYTISHLLAFLGAHHIFHVSRMRVKQLNVFHFSLIFFVQNTDELLAIFAVHACRHARTSPGHVFVNAFKCLLFIYFPHTRHVSAHNSGHHYVILQRC